MFLRFKVLHGDQRRFLLFHQQIPGVDGNHLPPDFELLMHLLDVLLWIALVAEHMIIPVFDACVKILL